jgi:hypothetical protein
MQRNLKWKNQTATELKLFTAGYNQGGVAFRLPTG